MKLAAGMQKKHWHIRQPNPHAEKLASQLKVPSLLAQVLANRKITDPDKARSFLSPKLTDLIEPEKMPGATQAVKRIEQALKDNEKIAIYGDYDVDGITSVAILSQLLTILGGNVSYYIPHRVDEGYGLNDSAIKQLANEGVNLIITVDCGITAFDSAALAGTLGVDLIITDHHQQIGKLPEAVAIVHPSLDDSYANPHSAGAMVAFKLAWAIVNEFKAAGKADPNLRQFLLNATTLAAMGTIADVVDLRGENRILTSFGLRALSQTQLCGLRALISLAGLTGEELDTYHIGFRIAPMLNAAGRMGHARLAVELLTSDSEMRSMRIAEYLKQQNTQRQKCQRQIFKEASKMITQTGLDHPDRKTIVLANENWHTGVVGIVASRVIDKFFRPAIMINTENGIGQGSARSVEGFNILEAISSCSELLISFGGHAMAAGLKIEKENIPAFIEKFEQYAQKNLTEEAITSRLDIECLCSIGQLNTPVVKQLQSLEPFGQGNPRPVFASKGVQRLSPPRRVGSKGEHLQIAITDSTGSVRCIGFKMGQLEKKILESDFFSVAYEPQMNTFNGQTNVQFVLTDIKFDEQ